MKYPKTTLSKARDLRKNMTDAERKLWGRLRADRVGVRFRRQVPFGPFILDFFCIKAKLAVEVDGGQHYEESRTQDIERDVYLKKHGVTVLRISNRELYENPKGAMQAIHNQIQKALFPPL